MAYLSNDTEEEQKQQANNQNANVDIYSSAAGNDQSQDSGSGAQAQQNAQTYSKTFSGGSGDNAPQQQYGAKPNAAQQQAQTGYINFQNYEQANPSQSENIASAGQKLIGGEKAKFETANGKFDSFTPPTAFSNQTDADNTAYGILSSDQYDPTKLQAWMTGDTSNLPTGIDYTQSDNYMRDSSELSETPIMGGSTKPSALDYLARPSIDEGKYSLGNRTFDQALLAGDPNAQSAISGNAKAAGELGTEITNGMNDAATKAQAWPGIVQANKGYIDTALTDISNNTNNTVSNAVANASNGGLTGASRKNAQDAFKTYLDWYNNPSNKGQVWQGNVTPQGQATTENTITPEQATLLNRIAVLHGQPEPYPDVSKVGHGPDAEKITGGGIGHIEPAQGITWESHDPSDASYNAGVDSFNSSVSGWASGGTAERAPTASKYLNLIPGSSAYGSGFNQVMNHAQPWLSPAEAATLVAMNDGQSQFYGEPSVNDLQTAVSQLMAIEKLPMSPQAKAGIETELNAVTKKLGGMNKDPYEYGLSLGLKPLDLMAMGILPPQNRGDGGQPSTTLQNPLTLKNRLGV